MATSYNMDQSVSNPHRRQLKGPNLLHELLSPYCAGDATAIDYLAANGQRQCMTYKSLDLSTNSLANHIASARPSAIIPVLIPQSLELYCAWIATLKSGAAFCPLDVDVPTERLKFTLDDTCATLVLTTSQYQIRLAEIGIETISVDDILEEIDNSGAHQSATFTTLSIPQENTAYVMYTSGSTGTPKGVPVSHASVTQSLLAHDEHVPHFKRFLQFASPTFDVSVFETFFPLFRGATVVTRHREHMLGDLPGTITQMQIDAAELTPTVAGTLLRTKNDAPCLKLLLTIGEMLITQVIREFGHHEHCEGMKDAQHAKVCDGILLPMYGPTEAAIHCTVAPNMTRDTRPGIIGRPLSSVTALVIQEANATESADIVTLPIGHVGELAVAGQLADGYLSRPEQTRAAFIESSTYGQVYRTGDRARMLPDGNLECLGRISAGQVKIRGQRVELGEIEEACCKAENVAAAYVRLIDDRVVAFCVPERNKLADRISVESCCKSWLPSFMRPNAIVILDGADAIPRLQSGKIDLKKLDAWFREDERASKPQTEDYKTDLETQIARCVSKVLLVQVRRSDDLWMHGLDSLQAIRLSSVLREEGISMSAGEILAAETVVDIAQAQKQRATLTKQEDLPVNAERLSESDKEEILANLVDVEMVEQILPCSQMQLAMLAETMAKPWYVSRPPLLMVPHRESCAAALSQSSLPSLVCFTVASPDRILILPPEHFTDFTGCGLNRLNFNCIDIELAYSVSVHDFQRAFQHLAIRNEILRSGFVQGGRHVFLRVVWKTLAGSLLDCLAPSHRTEGREETTGNLLRPLRLHFIGMGKGGRVKIRLSIHHALYDAYSIELMMQDLESLLSPGGSTAVIRPKFDEFVNHESQHHKDSEAQAYWFDALQGLNHQSIPVLRCQRTAVEGKLPFPQSPEAFPPRCACQRTLKLSSEELANLARDLRVSRQSVASAAFTALLSSYTGSTDLTIGSVSSGRTLPIRGIEQLIGPCLGTYPVRCDLAKLRTILDLLNETHRQHQGYLQQSVSLTEIKQAAKLLGAQPLFDALFIWQETLEETRRPERLLEITDVSDSLDYTVVLEIEPKKQCLSVKVTFDVSILPVEHANIFLSQFDDLVSLFAKFPETLLEDYFSTLAASDLSIGNANFSGVSTGITLCSRIECFASQHPSVPAIVFVDSFDPSRPDCISQTEVSYGELYERARKVANSLQAEGVSPDQVIGVRMEKCAELYICILGIILSGAAYLAFDMGTPIERVRRILEDSDCRLLIVQGSLSEEETSLGAVDIGRVSELEVRMSNTNTATRQSIEANGNSLAYVVYTSGSTGKPKGVLITRNNIMSNIDVLSRIYPTAPGSRLLQACSQAFDVSVFEILFTWHTGMTLCVATNDVLFRDMESFIDKVKISHLSLTPSITALIKPERVPTVQFLVTAGEPMNTKVFDQWSERKLHQGYGPSETTNICNVRLSVDRADFMNNVGPPLPNTSVFICDLECKDFKVLPRGALGEVWIGGEQVGRGYLNNDDLTSRHFISHSQYGRLYRSGDVGRLLHDDSLVILGRKDDQVKLRGQRIELGEINHALISQDAVEDAATILVKDEKASTPKLVSFWTPNLASSHPGVVEEKQNRLAMRNEDNDGQSNIRPASGDVVADIFATLEQVLPTYMVPDFLLSVDAIPLTNQGKLDKRALIHYFRTCDTDALKMCSREAESQSNIESLTEDETLVAELIAELTHSDSDSIGRDTSFYSLGLDSISAIKLAQRLREAGVRTVDVSQILRHASVRRLCRAMTPGRLGRNPRPKFAPRSLEDILDRDRCREIRQVVAETSHCVEKILPCTALQEAMLSSSGTSDGNAYRNRLVFKVKGDMTRVQRAWELVVEKHQILRTGFALMQSSDFAYAQIVLEKFNLPWRQQDASEKDTAVADKLRPLGFMLPPYRIVTSCGPSQDSPILTLYVHHALYDGEAMALLLAEVQAVYWENGRSVPLEVPESEGGDSSLSLPRPEATPLDLIWKQRLSRPRPPRPPATPVENYLNYKLSIDGGSADNFWQSKLADFNPVLLTEALIVPNKSKDLVQNPAEVVASISLHDLYQKTRRSAATLLSVLQVAWARLLACYLQRSDVCFGNVFSGRHIPVDGVDQIIGSCFNTLPVRATMRKGQSVGDLTRALHEYNTDVLPYQPSSLRQIQKQHSTSGKPLFDTLILLQQEQVRLDDEIWTLVEDAGDMDFPIILEAIPDAGRLRLMLHFQSQRVVQEDMAVMLNNFQILLQHGIDYPSARAQDFSMLEGHLPDLRRAPDLKTGAESIDGQRPLSGMETKVLDLLLHYTRDSGRHRPVAPTSSIFQFGLDSINAVQIAARLRNEGFDVSGGDVLEAATIERIALLCSSTRQTPAAPAFDFEVFEELHRNNVLDQIREVMGRGGRSMTDLVQAIRPCTPTQSGILAESLSSGGQLYFNRLTFSLSIKTDWSLLRRAWTEVAKRHEILRTAFLPAEDRERPFVMVTYYPEVFADQWASDSTKDSYSLNRSDRTLPLGSPCKPPWHIVITQSEVGPALTLAIHHALYDAQSLNAILSDVAYIYKHPGGRHAPTSIDAALGEILSQSSTQNDNAAGFFSTMGKDAQPTRFPDLNIHRSNEPGTRVESKKSSWSYSKMKTGCQQAGISLQVACQCAWAELLGAYTGQSKASFGVVLSGRIFDADMNASILPMINTVPMSLGIDGSVRQRLDQASKRNAGLIQHQYTPLSQIKRLMSVEGQLFDTVLALQQSDLHEDVNDLWRLIDEEAYTEHVVSLEIIPDNVSDRLKFQLIAKKSLVPAEHAEIVLSQFEHILLNVLEPSVDDTDATHQSLSRKDMSIIPAKVKRLPTSTALLHEMVDESVRKWPDKVALEFVNNFDSGVVSRTTWTYRQLNNEANKVAQLIIEWGGGPGDMVSVCFEKCPVASFAFLGIIRAGCAFVVIGPDAPKARKKFILRDSGSKILLCGKKQKEELEEITHPAVLALNEDRIWSSVLSTPPKLRRAVRPDDICYCLYTSGTTGQPKGCLITHDSVVQAMLSFRRIFAGHWDDDSRWLQFASFHFDVSVLEQFWSWGVGICVTSASRDLLFQDLPGFIKALQITHLDLTPSLARLLRPEDVPSLCRGVFITGGEQLRQDVLDAWGDTGVLYNFYGPSEVTIGCTVHRQVSKTAKPSNIGQQWDNVGTFVLDPVSKRPVIRGAVGELCLSGPLVGKGYLNRPDLTAQKFEYLHESGCRVYHTGDLVRLLHDNSFEFLGRADDQVKLRGQRLEVAEINQVIREADPTIKDVATMAMRNGEQQSEQLISFIALQEDRKGSSPPEVLLDDRAKFQLSRVRQHCNTHLPRYMVPTLIPISTMPLSANNKADANALKSAFTNMSARDLSTLSTSNTVTESADAELTSSLTALLCEYFQLAATDISLTSNFFQLGMDSISAIGFARRLKKAGFDAAQPSLVMQHSTVQELATVLAAAPTRTDGEDQNWQNAASHIIRFSSKHLSAICEVLGIERENVQKIAPCAPLQEGMISNAITSETAFYAQSFTFDLSRGVSLPRLGQAWDTVQAETEILRTLFVPTADGYAQVVLKTPCQSRWSIEGIENDEDTHERLRHGTDEIQDRIKNLGQLPWHVTLVQSRDRNIMVLHIFHALFDGTSLQLLLEQVAEQYLGASRAKSAALQFHDALPRGPLCNQEGAQAFFERNIRMVSRLELPEKFKVAPNTPANTCTAEIADPKTLTELANTLKVTMPAVFHAAWLLTLHRYFGVLLTLGIVVSGRASFEGAEKVVGPMFNTLPCNIELETPSSWSDLVRACHRFNVESLQLQHTALRDIAKWLKRDVSQLFDSLFVFQKEIARPASYQLWSEGKSESVPDYPLAVEIEQKLENSSFSATIVAQPHILGEESVKGLHQMLDLTIKDLLADPDRPLPTMTPTPVVETVLREEHKVNLSSPAVFEWTPEAIKIKDELKALSGVQILGPDTSIFELGLDSIDAIRLSARLKTASIIAPVGKIMQEPTIRRMVTILHTGPTLKYSHSSDAFDDKVSKLQDALKAQGVLQNFASIKPATPLQEGMLARFGQYLNVEVFEVLPGVDIQRMKAAWEAVIAANPILTTSFYEVEQLGTYAQVVQPQFAINWDTSAVDGKLADGLSMEHPFSLKLIPSGRQRMVLGLAHALYDGWSLELLHHDVALTYQLGQAPKRPPYDPTLRQILNLGYSEEAQLYWQETLQDIQPTLFNARCGALAVSVIRQDRLSKCSASSIHNYCKASSVTAQALGVTCFSIVLGVLLKRSQVCFGLVLSGRTSEGAEETMFPTMNTIAFPATINGTGQELLQILHGKLIEASEHQFFPLRKTQALNERQGPLFDALFIYQKRPQQDAEIIPELYRSVELPSTAQIEYPLNVEMEMGHDDSVIWRVACDSEVLGEKDVGMVLDALDEVLTKLIQSSGEAAHNIPEALQLPDFSSSTHQTCEVDVDEQLTLTPTLSDTERTIISVLSQASGTAEQDITRSTHLFSLGLDSISCIKVSSELKKCSISLPVSKMLAVPTVVGMAKAATTVVEAQGLARLSPAHNVVDMATLQLAGVRLEDVESIMPATGGQAFALGMWHASGGRLFYPTFHYRCYNVKPQVAKEAWAECVRRMPVLRTILLQQSQGLLSQIVLRTGSTISTPLMLCLETQAENFTVIKLKMHHALYDAISLPKIIAAFESLCRQPDQREDRNRSTAQTFHQFVSATAPSEMQKKFWTKYLSGAKNGLSGRFSRSLSLGSPRTHLYRPGLLEVAGVLRVCRRVEVTIQSLFLAAVARTLASEDIVIGIYLANRSLDIDGLPDMPYPAFNVVPLRIRSGLTLLETAKGIQGDLRGIGKAEHCGVSLFDVHRWTGVKLNCFVNFLPHVEAGESRGEETDTWSVLQVDSNVAEEMSLEARSPVSGHFDGEEAFLPAVDIEAAVRNGRLGVGLFAPQEMLTESEAQKMLEEVETNLEEAA